PDLAALRVPTLLRRVVDQVQVGVNLDDPDGPAGLLGERLDPGQGDGVVAPEDNRDLSPANGLSDYVRRVLKRAGPVVGGDRHIARIPHGEPAQVDHPAPFQVPDPAVTDPVQVPATGGPDGLRAVAGPRSPKRGAEIPRK